MAITSEVAESGPLTSPREIAKEFRIKFAPLMAAIEAGRVPHVKIGRARYLIRASFVRWLEDEAEAGRRGI